MEKRDFSSKTYKISGQFDYICWYGPNSIIAYHYHQHIHIRSIHMVRNHLHSFVFSKLKVPPYIRTEMRAHYYLSHLSCMSRNCPENCTKGEWFYADEHGKWWNDPTLNVQCGKFLKHIFSKQKGMLQ